MSDIATFTYLSSYKDEKDSSFKIDTSKAGLLSLYDTKCQTIFEAKQEDGRLSYLVIVENQKAELPHYLLPQLLRQFSNLHQLKEFLMNQNLIKVKKYGTDFKLELSLSCRGGFAWVPILICLASAAGGWALNHYLIRPYLLERLKAKINKSAVPPIVKKVACFALEAADFAFMSLLGGTIEAATSKLLVSHTMTKCTEKAVELFGKEVIGAEGIKAGLSYFKKFTMGLHDILELSPEITKLAIKHSLNEATIKEALSSFFYHLGKSLPRMIIINTMEKSLALSKNLNQEVVEAQVIPVNPVQVPADQVFLQIRDAVEVLRRDERMQRLRPAFNFYRQWRNEGRQVNDELIQLVKTACNLTVEQATRLLEELENRYAGGIPENIEESEDLNWLGEMPFP